MSVGISGGEMHEVDPKAHREAARKLREQAKAH
jgi:hypothetical protein